MTSSSVIRIYVIQLLLLKNKMTQQRLCENRVAKIVSGTDHGLHITLSHYKNTIECQPLLVVVMRHHLIQTARQILNSCTARVQSAMFCVK